MATRTAKPKLPDSMTMVAAPTNESPGIVRLVVDGVVDLYFVAELVCDVDGHRNFEVVGYRNKLRGYAEAIRRYNVLVETPRKDYPARGQCECEGGTYRPDRGPCRHIRFLNALWSRGLI